MEILCGGCGKTLVIGEAAQGDVQCPHCGRVIPAALLYGELASPAGAVARLEAAEESSDEFVTKARLALKRKLLVVCGHCRQKLSVEQRLAGTTGRCPACGGEIRIPAVLEDEPEATPAAPADAPGAKVEPIEPEPAAAPAMELAAQAAAPAAAGLPSPASSAAGSFNWRRHNHRKRNTSAALIVFIVAVLTGLIGVGARYLVGGRGASPPPRLHPPEPARTPSESPAPAQGPLTSAPGPVEPPAPVELPVVKVDPVPVYDPAETPPPAQSALAVTKVELSGLAPGGAVPAPQGKLFLAVSVRIQAGGDELKLALPSDQATLEARGQNLPCLGLPSSAPVPAAARPATFTISAGAARGETLLFLVSDDFAGGKLRVAGAGEADLAAPNRPAGAAAIAGQYDEAARYLRIAFENPVMEQVRQAARHALVVRRGADGLEVALDGGRLAGPLRPAGGDLFDATLSDGRASLACKLRLLEGGQTVVLYLADQPFHQVIYKRT